MYEENLKQGTRAALTPAEFGALYGKSAAWAYRLVYQGAIRVITPSKSILIPIGEVERLNATACVHTKRQRRDVSNPEVTR
jgi:hypothetical protein